VDPSCNLPRSSTIMVYVDIPCNTKLVSLVLFLRVHSNSITTKRNVYLLCSCSVAAVNCIPRSNGYAKIGQRTSGRCRHCCTTPSSAKQLQAWSQYYDELPLALLLFHDVFSCTLIYLWNSSTYRQFHIFTMFATRFARPAAQLSGVSAEHAITQEFLTDDVYASTFVAMRLSQLRPAATTPFFTALSELQLSAEATMPLQVPRTLSLWPRTLPLR
jgi:hypothetical protein